jgi:hypothetical protein
MSAKLSITLLLLLLSVLTAGLFFIAIPMASAEEVITILPGAQDHNRPRYLDITFYPIEKGKELTWFNDDDVGHRIIINSTEEEKNNINSTALLADSGNIKPESSYTYAFEEEGIYHFSSPTHP